MARATRGLTARSRSGSLWAAAALGVLPFAFLGLFFAWPVAAIIRFGVADGGVVDTLVEASTWRLAGFTVAQALAATVVAVLAGFPLAFLLARVRLPGITVVRTLVLVPFVLPTVVVGLAFRALWPDGGVLSIVVANAFFNIAVVARTVGGLWAQGEPRVELRPQPAGRASY